MSKKILIVDDAVETVSLLEAILQGQGYNVITAHNGKEALAKLQGERPAMVVIDVLMPEMDGFALYKALKQERNTSTIPIMVLTVRSRMEETFRALGAEEFIAKPFDGQQLLDKVKVLLGGNGQSADASTSTTTATVTKEKNLAQSIPGAKKVLVIGTSEGVVSGIKRLLATVNCPTEIVSKESQVVDKVLTFNPDILVLEVLLHDRPALEVITKLKHIPQISNKPIILFSFLDKERFKDTSIHQRSLAIESARAACLQAGANDSIGGFEEANFMHTIKKYL